MTVVFPSEPLFEHDPVSLARERRPRMLASLLFSSVLIPLAFFMVGSLVRLLPAERIVAIAISPSRFEPAPYAVAPPSAPVVTTPSVRIHAARIGIPIPVLDDLTYSIDASLQGTAGPPGPPVDGGGVVLGKGRTEGEIPINRAGEPIVADQLPTSVRSVKPIYPELARDAQLEGLVVVFALVGRDGRVLDVRLDPDRHVPILDPAALAAARQWRFEPAMSSGHAVAAWVSVPFRFVLHGNE